MTTATASSFREVEIVRGQAELKLNLHPGQTRVFESDKRFIFMLAGTQGGKTCFGAEWLREEISKCGGGDYLAVTSTYDEFKLKMLPELLAVFEGFYCAGEYFRTNIGRYWSGERVIELAENLVPGRFWAQKQDDPMWGRIILRSAEAKGGLEAATAKAAWLDEVGQPSFSRDAWLAVIRRLSLFRGRILGTTTLYEWNWLKTEVYDLWEGGNPDYDVVQFNSTMNPAFTAEEYQRAQDSMPAWKFDLFYRGVYTKPKGLIYDAFDEITCLIDRFEIPRDWLWYVGHDFGPANPAAMFYAMDTGTGYLYAVYSYKPGSTSVSDQCAYFKQLMAGRNVIKRIGGSQTEEGWRGDYTAHGWPISKPKEHLKAVDVGIARVYALHKLNRVFVFKDLYDYLDEKQSYRYKLGENYEALDEIENPSRYHLMDGERYILSDLAPETAIPSKGPRMTVYGGKPQRRGRYSTR